MRLGIYNKVIFLSLINVSFTKKIETVSDINLNMYTGKWFQAATSRSTKLLGTGIDFSNVTANYQCIDNCKSNNISVFNEGFDNFGRYTSIKGFSYCEDNNLPGKRKVIFEKIPFPGNYWIVKLGPIVNCQYDYAIVSGPVTDNIGTRFSLYVLCRNVNKYEEKYEKEVKQWCVDNGFKYYWNEYVKTKQN